jgi:hypothetical protein
MKARDRLAGGHSKPPFFTSCVGKTQGVPFSHRQYQVSKA